MPRDGDGIKVATERKGAVRGDGSTTGDTNEGIRPHHARLKRCRESKQEVASELEGG